jgi:nucleoside-diphosphate-sugar epimerase
MIGGTRFIGPGVARRLAEAGHQVTLFHRGQTRASLPESIDHLLGDRDDLGDFASEIQRLNPEVVIDMMLLSEKQATDLMSVVSGVARRVVVISSCDVYQRYDLLRGVEEGPVEATRVTEDSPLRTKYYPYRDMVDDKNDRLYDYDKILAERVVISSRESRATVLRLPVVYGPNDYQHRFAAHLRRMLDNRPAILLEEGEAEWRITRGYSENCAEAIVAAATSDVAADRIYNVGEPGALAEEVWVSRIADIVGWSGEILRLPNTELPKHLQSDICSRHHLEVDTGRIRQELDFTEPVGPDEALRLTLAWERENLPENESLAAEYEAEDLVLKRL